ncbi:hypothetical protein LPUS_02285 [Lasallia pustulata]|uniref:Uncharacterized protein n=1 Tax=Lasallia pustulata TaxID=136370 RepID=A0A1W5CSA4_9LECA|nr:hypothetical protein LPUS_02285 [Lasallia pustulata]
MNAIVYILYNANASVLGKVQYAYRKLTAPATDSPCAACDLTHGGLRLTETPRWSSTKARIGAAVQQLHKDEADRTILDFVRDQQATYPLVLARETPQDGLKVLMTTGELAACSKDHELFLQSLARNAAAAGIHINIKSAGGSSL